MYIIVWQFTVRPDLVPKFISAYNANGDWAQLFGRAEGYLGTELLASATHETQFVTIDRWQSLAEFNTFLEHFGREYESLNKELQELTVAEAKLGTFVSTDDIS